MSKKTGLIILLSSIFVIMLLVITHGSGKRLSDCAIGESDAREIMATRTFQEDWTPELAFGEERLVLDQTTGEYYYSLISDDANAYDPKIRARASNKRVNVSAVMPDNTGNQSIITDEMIREADEIDLLFYDEENYSTGKLICTTLPIMSIACDREIGEEEVSASMELTDNRNDTNRRFLSSDATIRLRGGTTMDYPKHPYKLSLTTESLGNHRRKNNMSLLGMRKDDDWVLYAAYNDQEKIRNVFSQNLWTYSCATDNAFGIDTGLEYKYLELFINGEYQGLYALGDTPDEKNLGLDASKSEGYYKKYGDSLEKFIPKSKEAEQNPVKYKELSELIYDYFFELHDHCFDADYLKNSIDMDNALDFYLFICLIQGRDNLHKNYYTILKDTEDGYKSAYIPWDMDLTWGNTWIDADYNNHTAMYREQPYDNYLFNDGYMYWLLYNNDVDTYNKLAKKYEELRKGPWSDEKLMALIGEYEEDIFFSGAYLRDKEKWPEGNYLEAEEGYSLSKFKSYVTDRFAQMDGYIQRLKSERTDDPFVNQTLSFRDYESADKIIRFDNRRALEDETYSELLKKSGINLAAIMGESGLILYRASDNTIQEMPIDEDLKNGVDTILGRLRIGQTEENSYGYEDEYSVFVDDVECMEVFRSSLPIGISVISKDKHGKEMLLEKRYRVKLDWNKTREQKDNLETLRYVGGNVLLIFSDYTDVDFTFLDKYDLNMGEYQNLSEAEDCEKKLVFLLNGDTEKGYLINSALVSDIVAETDLGTYAYFEKEGRFWLYMNGNELLTGDVGDEDEFEKQVAILYK